MANVFVFNCIPVCAFVSILSICMFEFVGCKETVFHQVRFPSPSPLIRTFFQLMISRYDYRTSFRIALMLSHVGEFGFVVLGKASGLGLLGHKVHVLLLGTTTVSLFLTPFLFKLISWVPHGMHFETPPSKPPYIDLVGCVRGLQERRLVRCPRRVRSAIEYLTGRFYSTVRNRHAFILSHFQTVSIFCLVVGE